MIQNQHLHIVIISRRAKYHVGFRSIYIDTFMHESNKHQEKGKKENLSNHKMSLIENYRILCSHYLHNRFEVYFIYRTHALVIICD